MQRRLLQKAEVDFRRQRSTFGVGGRLATAEVDYGGVGRPRAVPRGICLRYGAPGPGTTFAFLPCVMSTSGRIYGEFLRLLYVLAHRRSVKYLAGMGDDEPGTDAFTVSPGAGLNTSGSTRLPSVSETPSPSHVALTLRAPLALDSGHAHLAPLRVLMPTSFASSFSLDSHTLN